MVKALLEDSTNNVVAHLTTESTPAHMSATNFVVTNSICMNMQVRSLQTQRVFQFPTSEMNFHDTKTPHPQLEIVSDKRDPHARMLALEDVLSRNKEVLESVEVYDAISTSLFTYDINENVLQAFCELWHLVTKTICVGIGELSISLWDMRMIGGLHVHGSFYNQVVSSAQELTQDD
ncbi:hypothetical protein HAX54_044845 [Datura stramonium]|uniref:Uncharacterized protein n=1 Tax=Datura stramonium TaxID=4076 RepID=A0ABS8WJ07_DATST|nr:hypothetical protein [Datura stramonium]